MQVDAACWSLRKLAENSGTEPGLPACLFFVNHWEEKHLNNVENYEKKSPSGVCSL